MKGTASLRFRMAAFFSSLLACVLVLFVGLTSVASQRIAHDHAVQELSAGGRIFRLQLDANGRHLALAARLLAADFGFRQVLASGDVPTMESVLLNHRHRVQADLALLSDLRGRLLVAQRCAGHTGRSSLCRRAAASHA